MKVPRDLSGQDLVQTLCRKWGYRVVHQEGSHVVLETDDPSHQRLAVPAHRYLRIGTLHAILRTVANHKRVERDAIIESL
ncbi:MAG: type II toxin-antitoxin system HicA family toxin [Acidobacteriota bacterium]|nr:type II toxin-antitoxin system HicA family toxin [Acidobacteriota bacterium]